MPENKEHSTESIKLTATLLGNQGSSGSRKKYQARFVKSGRVRAAGNRESNIVIEPDALQKAVAAGMFDGKAVFVDHAGFFDYPSMRNLAGVTSEAVYNEDTKSVDGAIQIYSLAGEIATLLDEILSQGEKGPDVGLSIVFWPVFETDSTDKERLRRITGIKHVESVDLVFEPAADGRILQALSAFQITAAGNPPESLEVQEMPEETITSQPSAQSTPTAGNGGGNGASPQVGADVWLPVLAANAAAGMIANSGLPQASQDRLRSQNFATPQEVQAAIGAEREYLAALTASGVVQIGSDAPRGRGIQMGMDGLDRVTKALEALLLGTRPPDGIPPLTGIREAYNILSGDYEMTGVFHEERVQLANVNSSTMAGLVANALNKVVVNEFMQYPRWWEKFTNVQDFSSLQQAKFITLGGIGELPTVAEGAAYTELAWDDNTETATFVKKGGYLGITIEAIDKDDTRRLQGAPRALAQAAWLTLGKAISSIFTSNSGAGPLMADGDNVFHANHSNVGSTALSVTALAAVRTAMRKQTELNSGERLGALTAPKFLLVPPDLEVTALQVLGSEMDYSYALANAPEGRTNVFADGNSHNALLMSARDRVIVIDLWTDTDNWAAIADPRLYPSIGIGFRYGRTPEVFSVASPTAGLMFSNDTLPVKVRFFFAVGAVDYRGMYKQNV